MGALFAVVILFLLCFESPAKITRLAQPIKSDRNALEIGYGKSIRDTYLSDTVCARWLAYSARKASTGSTAAARRGEIAGEPCGRRKASVTLSAGTCSGSPIPVTLTESPEYSPYPGRSALVRGR